MKRDVGLIEGIVALLFLVGAAHAAIWYVHPDSALNSIQAGLDSCADNDTVLVGPGTYYENIVWPNTQSIHLISELGPDTTVVDGDSISRVTTIAIDVDTTTIIAGFTIRNGYTPDAYGGGIYCAGASPKIIDNIISSNIAAIGGGIACEFSSPLIINNIIVENTAMVPGMFGGFGGGIWCHGSSTIITGNTIARNAAENGGGGVQCMYCYDSLLTIHDNVFTDNTAGSGAAVGCLKSSPIITKNTIVDNIAIYDGGGIYCYYESSPRIKGNTINGNTADDGAGVYCINYSSPVIDSCTISNNNGDGVYSSPFLFGDPSSPVINYNNIIDNEGYGVNNSDSTIVIDATYNWWGDTSGPGGVGPGTGDSVSDYVDFVPWDTVPYPWGIEEYKPSEPIVIALQISPNPFRDKVSITFSMEYNIEDMAFTIYDATGRVVKEFNHLTNNQIFWNGTDNLNRRLPSGVYFLKFQAADYSATEKLLLIR